MPVQAASSFNASDVIVQATMSVAIVKGLVDLIRMCWGGSRDRTPPFWVSPIAALLLGPSIIALLNLSVRADFGDPATIAKVLLAGFMTTLSAVGITELHNQASPAMPTLQVASSPVAAPMAMPTPVTTSPLPSLPAAPSNTTGPSLAGPLGMQKG